MNSSTTKPKTSRIIPEKGRTSQVSASAMRCFKACRRRYFFQYVERLKLLITPKPLSFGGAVHKGVENLLNGRSLDDMKKAIIDSYSDEDLNDDIIAPDMALIAVLAFDKYVDWRSWKILDVEKRFEVSMGYAKHLIGFLDTLVEIDGLNYIVEHKTITERTLTERYLNHLLFDDQAGLYIVAANKMGYNVRGALYNIMLKPDMKPYKATPFDRRKYKKDGTLYANLRERDETNEDYLVRVKEWYDSPTRFVQHIVYRTEPQLEAIARNFDMVLKDMRSCEKDGTFYANGNACSILPCSFESICIEDTPEARSVNFTNEEQRAFDVEQKERAASF